MPRSIHVHRGPRGPRRQVLLELPKGELFHYRPLVELSQASSDLILGPLIEGRVEDDALESVVSIPF